MADFRIRFIGLAAAATMFAGLSFGQTLNCGAGAGGSQTINPGSPILVRAESEADLVSDIIINCPNNGAVVANGQLTVFGSLPITSKAVTGLTTTAAFQATGNSEAVLQVTNITTGATVVYQGTVTGTVISFTGVSFPASFTATISNVRVNPSGAGVGSTPLAVTESVFAGSNGLATYVNNNIIVGYALKSLVAPAFTQTAAGTPIVANYVVCTGNSAAFAAPGVSFTVIAAETFGGFFKTQTGNDSITGTQVRQNGEQGSYQNGAIGTASSGTQIQLTFANVPSVATVYVPLTVNSNQAGAGTLTLSSSTTAATSPAGVVGLSGGVAGFTPSSGGLSVVYTVTASTATQVESFNIPVYVVFSANTATAQGPITVLESYAPAVALTGLPTSIPVFAPSSATPLNASSITICQTSLLFPFLTNQLGFDSGIAISNTSNDPLGFGGRSLASNQSGTCTLNFYGAGVTGGFLSAPAPNPGGGTTAFTQAAGTVNAFLLSSVAPGFQGYMIANCNFLYAHGFTYITYNLTQNNGVAMGYLAEVLSITRTTAGGNPEGVSF